MAVKLQDAKIEVVFDTARARASLKAMRKKGGGGTRGGGGGRGSSGGGHGRRGRTLVIPGTGGALRTVAGLTTLAGLQVPLQIVGAAVADEIREGGGFATKKLRGIAADTIIKMTHLIPWIESKVVPFFNALHQTQGFAMLQALAGEVNPSSLGSFYAETYRVNAALAETEFSKNVRRHAASGKALGGVLGFAVEELKKSMSN